MKQYSNIYRKGKYICIILLFIVVIFSACGSQEEPGRVAVQKGGTTEQSSDQNNSKDSAQDTRVISVYTMDLDSLEAEPVNVTVKTPEGLTPQIVIDAVVGLFEAQGQTIGILNIEQDEDTITVDFDQETAPVTGVGSAEETAILDCISMSLLDNLDNCMQVVFHAGGEAYVSGHYGFEYNEAYKWKNG